MSYFEKIEKIVMNISNIPSFKPDFEQEKDIRNLIMNALYRNEDVNKIADLFEKKNAKKWFDELVDKLKKDRAFSVKKLVDDFDSEYLDLIYSKSIIVNDMNYLMRNLSKNIEKNIIFDITSEFHNLTNYCIETNKDKDAMKMILVDTYLINAGVSEKIAELYSNNKIELKMNYIIEKLNQIRK